MHVAKTHLSRLVAEATKGEPFVIARAGRPPVKMSAITSRAPARTGFLKGQIDIPDDFDTMFEEEFLAMFESSGGTGPGEG